jgi:hypothetical protein
MRIRTHILHGTSLLALASAGLWGFLPSPAAAETPQTVAQSDDWQFSASIYLWFASLGGTANFPVAGTSTDFNVDAKTLLNNLNLGAMGEFDVHKGQWGGFTDVLYMDLGGSKTNTRDFTLGGVGIPATTTAYLNLDVKSWIWTIAGEYRVIADPAWTVDLLAGARYLDLSQTLSWSISGALGPLPPASRTGNSEVGGNVWDAIVGVKGRYLFGADGKWSIPFYLDGGAGDSEYTYQALLGAGYSFHWGEVTAMWRYLRYTSQSSSRIEDLYFSGPMIAVTFRW